jgi:RNA polymerase-binding transcription factor DksA
MPTIAAAKERLQSRLAELGPRFAHIVRDLDTPGDPDSGERAIEMEDDEVLEGEGAIVEREIASVRRALARIEDGSYGICVRCGNQVGDARLDARPEAALCIDCARNGP